jgi:hypothetical protein
MLNGDDGETFPPIIQHAELFHLVGWIRLQYLAGISPRAQPMCMLLNRNDGWHSVMYSAD